MHISTLRATPETRVKLANRVKELRFKSIGHFFMRSMETFLEQTDAGQTLKWPLWFETEQRRDERVAAQRRV